MKVVTMKDFEKESKRREFKENVKQRLSNAGNFVREYKEEFMILSPIIIAGITGVMKVSKGMIRNHNLSKEQDLKELYCYDRSLGHYWKLRKPLSNNDWITINDRKKNGETLADILSSMNVLD